MAGLDPNEYVNKMNFNAARLLERHMNPPPFEATWDNFVLSANKWLTQQGLKEYDKIDLANMRGGSNPTDKILSDLGHKGCRVANLVGILQDAKMYDILEAEEFNLLEHPSKAGFTETHRPCPVLLRCVAHHSKSLAKAVRSIRLPALLPSAASLPSTFCCTCLRCAACIGKWLSEAVLKPYVFLRGLLLLAGDVERNPGPIQAEQVLKEYRERFIVEMDASSVVSDFVYHSIIPDGVRESITEADGPRQRNSILHDCLLRTCTNEALMRACDIITSVQGNPKMSALGKDMQRWLESAISTGFTETDCSTLYQKAIRDNPTITLHISKAMTIGPPQVGKSTVRRRLLGLPLPEVSSSTPVMERADTVSLCPSGHTASLGEAGPSSEAVPGDEHTSDVEGEASSDDSEGEDDDLGQSVAKRCKYESHTYMEDGNEWVMLNNASVMHSLLTHLQEKIGGRLPTSNSRLRQLESGHYVYLEDQHPSALIVGYNPSSVADMSRRMYQELKDTDKADVVLPDAHLLQFLDCGGQLAYHDILPIFVNIPAIYLHVFKVSKELTECPIDELCSPRGEKKYSAKSALSVAEMITRSMMTVHLLADKRDTLPAVLKCDSKSPKPHVVLVGTHLDELDEKDRDARLKAISGTLRQAVHSESHDLEGMLMKDPKRYGTFFPVSNVSQKKCTCRYLKKRIRDQATADAVKVEVPVRWYLHLLLEISQGEKPLYTYSEFYKRCKEEGSITDLGEFHAMVTYFHALGLLIHLCEADVGHTEDSDCLVFTNPSFLYENISKIYQVQFEKEVEGLGKIKLKSEGKLTEEALQELGVQLDYNHFMDLLVQLFIGAEIEPQKGKKEKREEGKEEGEERREGKRRKRILYVPSVLVNSSSDSARDAAPSGVNAAVQKHSVSFAIAFKHTSFVPCGVFTGMIARLQSERGWDIRTFSSSRTRMKFAVGALGTVNVLDYVTHISVEIGRHDGLKPEQYQEYRDTIVTATADSFCFLFHSKADKDPQSGTCIACSNEPYLVLGQTCRLCSSQPGVDREVLHFAELKVENYIPVSVRCWEAMEPDVLGDSELEQVPFQNISHTAVIEEQQTRCSQKGTVAMKVPCCVSSKTGLAEQVLDRFRDRFIAEMDANAIAMDLQHRGVISDGDLQAIKQEIGTSRQNRLLHARLKKTCTVEALMDACDIITMVEGNPKLKSLGQDMKTELEKGLSCVGECHQEYIRI